MDRTFQKFLRSGVDLLPLGIERRADNTPYFCTPKGATIFGWAGVDGIHFCFIRGFGGMVFAVSPMNGTPNEVHPIAKDFTDFLRLLLACGDAAALEQAWSWDETQFETFLRENPPTQEQQRSLSELAAKMKLTPMERPWAYIRELQDSFDYGRIRYTEDYYDTEMNPSVKPVPEWKVCFEGGFRWCSGKDRAGIEIGLDRQFDWAGHFWVAPAAYSCGKGLVLDLCMRAEAEDIRKFMKKWDLNPENDSCENFTPEQQMQIDLDNPLCLDFIPHLELNGKVLKTSCGYAVSFNPCFPQENEAKWVIDHYGLDDSFGWLLCRYSFLWQGKRRTEVRSLSLTMEQEAYRVPGPHFRLHAPGDSFVFSHPAGGTEYTLTALELEQQTINYWRHPMYFTAMSYKLSPQTDEIRICDCAEGDKPSELCQEPDDFSPEAQNMAACVGIIGGADGPTTIVLGSGAQESTQGVCSALHFEPVQTAVEWRVEFYVRQFGKERFLLK